jgi:hypothetical protein
MFHSVEMLHFDFAHEGTLQESSMEQNRDGRSGAFIRAFSV